MSDRFKAEQCCFLLGYFDSKLRLPNIKTLVFIGKVLAEGKEYWRFAPPKPMGEGAALELDMQEVLELPEETLEMVKNWDELILELTEKNAQK